MYAPHAVTAVGYDFSDVNWPYFIMKNSWGPDSGEMGYFRIIKGHNMCRLLWEPSFPIIA